MNTVHPYAESRKRARKNGDTVLKVKRGIKHIFRDQKLKQEDMNTILKD